METQSARRQILDFGCGCGRVLRHWKDLPSTKVVQGTDYNRRLADWSRQDLPFVRVSVNELTPPLAYAESSFDLVQASVFTHLPENLCEKWMAELYQIVKPGGGWWVSLKSPPAALRMSRAGVNGRLVATDHYE